MENRKTTIAALIIKYLVNTKNGSILAIDADPSSNLNMSLGMDIEWTVGDIREELLDLVQDSSISQGAAIGSLPGGFSKREYLDYQIRKALSEGERYDLIAMGRSEGPGCYCAVNHNLRQIIDNISENYDYVVIDNEAGMEHLSRRTTRDVHYLFVISDPSPRGLMAAKRIADLKEELDINIKNTYLLINKAPPRIPEQVKEFINKINLPLIGMLPQNEELVELEFSGVPTIEMDNASSLYVSMSRILDDVLLISES